MCANTSLLTQTLFRCRLTVLLLPLGFFSIGISPSHAQNSLFVDAPSYVVLPNSQPLTINTYGQAGELFHLFARHNNIWSQIADRRIPQSGRDSLAVALTTALPPPPYTFESTDLLAISASSPTISNLVPVLIAGSNPHDSLRPLFEQTYGSTPTTTAAGVDQVRDVAIDPQGYIYLTGATSSPNFPTTDGSRMGLQNNPQYPDTFLMIIRAGQIVFSTVLGGPNYDRNYAIDLDNQGNVYTAGRCGPAFPTAPNTFQPTASGTRSHGYYGVQFGCICKFTRDLQSPTPRFSDRRCTFHGNDEGGIIRDLAVVYEGSVTKLLLVGGIDNPLTTFPWMSSTRVNRLGQAAQYSGIFFSKISAELDHVDHISILSSGSDLIYGSSAIHSERYDKRSSAAVIVTSARARDLPLAPGRIPYHGGADIYLLKVSSDGSRILSSTYAGGSGEDHTETHNVAVGPDNSVLVTYTTNSTDATVTSTTGTWGRYSGPQLPPGTSLNSNYFGDLRVERYSPELFLTAAVYFGGILEEGGEGVDVDPQGSIYVTGSTRSSDLPGATPGSSRGGFDGFLAKLSFNSSGAVALEDLKYLGGPNTDYVRAVAVNHLQAQEGGQNFTVAGAGISGRDAANSNLDLLIGAFVPD